MTRGADHPMGVLSSAFATSAAHAGVSRDLLVAIAKVEDGLGMPAERMDIEVDNEVPAAGPLQLRRGKLDTLALGAKLANVTEVDLRMHADVALDAGALVLADVGARLGAHSAEMASWAEALEEMSGFADEPHRRRYAHQVFAVLASGGRFEGRDGEVIELSPHPEIPPSLIFDVDVNVGVLATAQFPGAEWIPTSCVNKCTAGRGGFKVEFIVIHDTEGGWNASVATLQNDPNKSVQYIIGEDGRTAQFITEETTGWHAGNFNFNQRSVGIEHVGYSTKPFPEKEYVASAKLVTHLANKYKVPRDRAHIIGHDQIPNGNKIAQSSAPCSGSPRECRNNPNYGGASKHTDPGVWEWPTFMVRFGGTAKCNDVTNLWNCSNDKKKAFRCVDGKVQVATCDGLCEVKELGVDDKCTIAASTTGGASEPDAPSSDLPPEAASDQTGALGDINSGVGSGSGSESGEEDGFLPPASSKRPVAEAGCSMGRSASGYGAGWLLALGLLIVSRRRLRR